MSEYTKGPWFVNTVNRDREYPSAKVGSIDWECDCCCNCDRVSCSECDANAHLISAAPDMYEALKELLNNPLTASYYTSHKDMDMAFAEEVPGYKADCESITNCFDACIAALAKAEGRE